MLNLPMDKPRPPEGRRCGAMILRRLDARTEDRLRHLALSEGCGAETVLLAAWLCLLSRWSGETCVVVGLPTHALTRQEPSQRANSCSDTSMLRGDLSDDPSFRAFLRQIGDAVPVGRTRLEGPVELLAAGLAPDANVSRCEVLFASQDTSVEAPRFAPRHDLALIASEAAGQRSFRFEYAAELFTDGTIDGLADQFLVLLRGVVEAPDTRVSCLPLLDARERAALESLWREAQVGAPPRQCLHEVVSERARHSPEAIALICGEEQLCYGELDRRADCLAGALTALGAGPDVLIGLCAERSIEMIVGILAILKAGSAYLPLDPDLPRDRLAFMLEDARPPVVLTQRRLGERLPESAATLLCLDELPEGLPSAPPKTTTPKNLAYCIYTSGSTGRPKGVLVSHANVTRLLATTRDHFCFGARDVWTLFHSFAFDFSVWELFGCLAYGGRLVIVPLNVVRSPDLFFALLARHAVTVLNMTPSAFRQFITVAAERPKLASLRVVIFGGEALYPASLSAWTTQYGWDRPSLVNMYGITETTVHVSFRRLTADDARMPSKSPIGVPLPDLGITLLDAAQTPVPRGIPGEMYVRGAGVTRGYLNLPELTERRFIPDPYSGAGDGRLYRTGDLARLTCGGELEYLGRCDEQVKLRGYRIELGEIEACLTSIHPVAEAVAGLVGDAAGDKKIVAWITAKEGQRLDRARIRQEAASVLPHYMLPARLVAVPALPLNGNGKIDRRRLLEWVDDARSDEVRFEPPTSELEIELAVLWERVLDVRPVGASDNFVDLGGDSLRAIHLVRAARERSITFTITELMAAKCLAELAAIARVHDGPVGRARRDVEMERR
ncbi:amino acid adenylation domain-containing protein [Myxococcus sp. AM010]|uniref:amino acid adenylation domain-containing protein n=1 Tax=Myxococcus sp. AM010 TaxID=2745138 RepID=UPI0034CD1002